MEEEVGEDSPTPVVVTARVRPPGSPGVIVLPDEKSLMLDSSRTFRFDRVLGPDSTEEDLYELGGPGDFLPLALDGYDLNFIAYGVSGSGKTHSLFGGILPRFTEDLFRKISSRFDLRVSFLDVLDESILDLLSENCVSPDQRGLSWVEVHSVNQVINALETGLSILKRRPKDLYDASSSHSVFTLRLVTKSGLHKKTSLIKFADLAGSDHLNKGPSRLLGTNVNLGLLSLANVISALGDPRRNASVIPYADSALTRILSDAFGGNSVTLLLATLSGNDADQTLNTCLFAELASNVRNRPVPNIVTNSNNDNDDTDMSFLRSVSATNNEVSACFSPPTFRDCRGPPESVTHAPIPLRPSTSPLTHRSPLSIQMYYDPLFMQSQNPYHKGYFDILRGQQQPSPLQHHLQQQQPIHNNLLFNQLPPNGFIPQTLNNNMIMNNHHTVVPNEVLTSAPFNGHTPYLSNNVNCSNLIYNNESSGINTQIQGLPGQFQRLSTVETESPINMNPLSPPLQPQLGLIRQPDGDFNEQDEPKGNQKLERIEEESETCYDAAYEEDYGSEEEEDDEEEFDSELDDEIEPNLMTIQDNFRKDTENISQTVVKANFYESLLFKKEPKEKDVKALRKELINLTASNKASQNQIAKTDADLKRIQNQIKELKSSIQVKETLVQDLLKTEEETKVINKKFKYKLRLLEEKSHHVRKELRGAQRLVREFKGDPDLQNRVELYNEEIKKLEEKIGNTEKVLNFNLPENPESQEEILKRMNSEHEKLQEILNAELDRKSQLEEAVAHDQCRIRELEGQLREQKQQLDLSLKLSQDLERQRDKLKFEAEKLQSQISHSTQLGNVDVRVKKSEGEVRQEIIELRSLKDDLFEERSFLETRYQNEKRRGRSLPKKEEFRLVELDVILEAMDASIEHKNDILCERSVVYETSSKQEELLLSKLAALSINETKSLLRKFVYRTIDVINEGNHCNAELERSEDERRRLYRKLQELNYHYSSREVAYERKLDIQKTEHLRQLSALRKQINDPDAYEYKLKQLKDELSAAKQDSQRYKRFYKAYSKHLEKKEDKSSSNHRPLIDSNMPPPQQVTRERKKLIVQSKVSSTKPKRK